MIVTNKREKQLKKIEKRIQELAKYCKKCIKEKEMNCGKCPIGYDALNRIEYQEVGV